MSTAWLDPIELPAGPGLDLLDGLIGRAVVDRAFCRALLAEPAVALASMAMPPLLRLALVTIRADSLAQFASRALAAQASLAGQGQGPPHEGALRPAAPRGRRSRPCRRPRPAAG
jgi:hypothetical protein